MPTEKNNILRADLHIHTHHSPDGDMEPETIINRAKEIGLDVIAVTDHNTTKGGLETKELAKKIAPEILVIVGQETLTKQGEILIYNIEDDIEKGQDIKEVCGLATRRNGFLIVPHPFDKLRFGIGGDHTLRIQPYIIALEGMNSRVLISKYNKKAIEFAIKHQIPAIGGSDAHFKEEIGRTMTLIESKKNLNDIFQAIKSNKVEITGELSGLKPHIETLFARVKHKIKK